MHGEGGPAGERVPAGGAQDAAQDAGPAGEEAGAGAGDGAELLKARLAAAGRELAERAEALDARRQEVFGGGELRLAGAAAVPTARPAVPADLAPVGNHVLFAANPAEVAEPGDVFQVLAATDGGADATTADAAAPGSASGAAVDGTAPGSASDGTAPGSASDGTAPGSASGAAVDGTAP
ncbi:MAG: DNA repair ATPase, partial [Actinomycetia bacterium]|nr:DNA repair ATPase [Actinomycetes bacterium]